MHVLSASLTSLLDVFVRLCQQTSIMMQQAVLLQGLAAWQAGAECRQLRVRHLHSALYARHMQPTCLMLSCSSASSSWW